MRAAALYIGGYQMIPCQHLAETFLELFACPLSQGTLANIVRSRGSHAATAMKPVREALLQPPTAHAAKPAAGSWEIATGCTSSPPGC